MPFPGFAVFDRLPDAGDIPLVYAGQGAGSDQGLDDAL